MGNVIYVNFYEKKVKNKIKKNNENNMMFNSYINNYNIKKAIKENNENIIKKIKLEKEINELFNIIFPNDE